MTFVDPAAPTRGGYEPRSYEPDFDAIELLSIRAEEADDAFAVAADEYAVAKNAEDKAYHTAVLLREDEKESEAAKDRVGRAASLEERLVRRSKESAMESAKEHLRAVLAQLSAAQTKHKTVDRLG